ncbi:hypothetical protein HTG_00930 [Natrinema mahii]|nr:hypothetical protein HTG_00930 [Natrinema mahii]
MSLRKRLGLRLHRALLYWGLLDHPYGREYAKERYTPLGGESEEYSLNENDDSAELNETDR